MKNYIVYNNFGEILRTGVCNDSDFNLQGEFVIEGFADDSCQYIENGKIIDMPEKPDCKAYFDFLTKKWILDLDEQNFSVKNQRVHLLNETDWTQLPDVPEATRTKWQEYRQALRDITAQPGFPETIVWPELPQ